MGLEASFEGDDFVKHLMADLDEVAHEHVEETIAQAIGPQGLKQLKITYDNSDPNSLKVIIEGPEDLRAKAYEALGQPE
jgi:hypothetical protein